MCGAGKRTGGERKERVAQARRKDMQKRVEHHQEITAIRD